MDPSTQAAYDRDAADFAADWDAQPPPIDLQAAVKRHFTPGPTADIGCGSGRDVGWLTANFYPARGYDASESLLAEAKKRFPGLPFQHASLPALEGVPRRAFLNVLCETVIMHLPPALVMPSVEAMLSLLKPGGTLYLSWRVTEGAERRDGQGRLYTAFDPALVLTPLAATTLLLDEQVTSLSSSKIIRRVVARMPG